MRHARPSTQEDIMTVHAPITTPFGAESTAAEVVDGHRSDRPPRHRDRRRLRHRRRDRPGAGRRRRRGDPRGPRPRRRRAHRRGHHRDHRQQAGARRPGWTSPTRPRSPRSSPPGTARWTSWSTTPASWPRPLMRTPEGWEMQFATNHLGHFALATGLHGALAAAGGARVVSVSSVRPPAVAGGLRRHPLPDAALRAVGRLRTVEDRQRAVRGRGDRGAGPTTASPSTRCMPGGIRTEPAALRHRRGAGTACAARRGGGGASWKTPEQGAATSRAASRPRRCSTASAAATSRTATRPAEPARHAPRGRGVRPGPRQRHGALAGLGGHAGRR